MDSGILVVDDEQPIRSALQGLFEDEGYLVTTAASGEEALAKIRKMPFACVVLDIWMPGIDGLETLTRIGQIDSSLPVIMMSGHATIDTAVKATKQGAFDFLEKPLSSDRLLIQVRNAIEKKKLQQQNSVMRSHERRRSMELIGEHPTIVAVRKKIAQIAPNRGAALLLGEHGVGKTIAAKMLHNASGRDVNAWCEVNLATISPQRFESVLFGEEGGGRASVAGESHGKVEIAQGGSLYLDEIGDLGHEAQAVLLNLLQSQRFCRVGGSRSIRFDVRLIAGSSMSLSALQEMLREDLFKQLAATVITLPALHQRPDDIPLVIEHFARWVADDLGVKEGVSFDSSAMERLKQYHWPGNLREMHNYIERCQIHLLDEGSIATVFSSESMPAVVIGEEQQVVGGGVDRGDGDALLFAAAKEQFEVNFLRRSLEQHDWNISHTAAAIGIERSQLHRKMRALNIVRVENA
ncbi:MAG: sigma-54 dependent transcriptional regulator [Mariprofundales bacterium]|nr:sigma-54 dependent transcriptional regulator [Mariprofundales bacterium]